MARAVWSGSISFGLVNVPVKAFSALRDHDVHFHQIDKKSGARVRTKKFSEKSGREVKADDIEMGFEVNRGTYVTFEKEELAKLALGGREPYDRCRRWWSNRHDHFATALRSPASPSATNTGITSPF